MIGIDPDPTAWPGRNDLAWRPRRTASTDCWPCQASTTSAWSSTPHPRPRTSSIGKRCATSAYACSTSHRRLSGRSASRWSTSRTTSTRRTSTWSPAAARPRCRSSPRSTSRRWCPMPRSCRRSHPNPPAQARGPTSTSSPKRPPPHSRVVGGAQRSKAVIILNPADPPFSCATPSIASSRATAITRPSRHPSPRWSTGCSAIRAGIPAQAAPSSSRRSTPTTRCTYPRPESSSAPGSPRCLQVTGAAHYLPAYAGNLDIMTSAALATAERIAAHSTRSVGASR